MAKEKVCPWPRGAAVDLRGVCLHARTYQQVPVCGPSFADGGTPEAHGGRGRKVPDTQPHAVLKPRGNWVLNYAGSFLMGPLLPTDFSLF